MRTELRAPLQGRIVQWRAAPGDTVGAGDLLVILEAMKMELPVVAPRAGTIEAVLVTKGDVATRGSLLVKLSRASAA